MQRQTEISLPSTHAERRIAIRIADWKSIRQSVSELDSPFPRLEVAFSILFAISATAGVSVVPISYSQGLPWWVTPFFGVVFLSTLLTGLVCVFLDRRLGKRRKGLAESLCVRMDEIEKAFASE